MANEDTKNVNNEANGNSESNGAGAPAAVIDPTAPLNAITDKDVIKSIHNALGGQRVVFADLASALAKITEAAEKTNNFAGLPIVGFQAETEEQQKAIADSEIYVCTVTKRISNESKKDAVNALRAIVLLPIPSVERFSQEQPDFVSKLVQREAADVAFTGIRGADTLDDLQNAVNGIPITPEEIAVSSRSSAMDTSVFDECWSDFRAAFVKARPAFDKAIPAKPLVLKAFRSKSYSELNPFTETLSRIKDGETDSGWTKLLKAFIKAVKQARDPKTGEPKNYDISVLESWLETRDTHKLSYNVAPQDVSIDELDFG